jgi:hypothetical protein
MSKPADGLIFDDSNHRYSNVAGKCFPKKEKCLRPNAAQSQQTGAVHE